MMHSILDPERPLGYRGRRRRILVPAVSALAFALLLGAWAPARAQSESERIRQLEREVAALKAEVAKLGAAGVAGTEASPAPAAGELAEIERKIDVLAAEIEKLKIGEAAVAADRSTNGMGPAASKIYRGERGVSIGGYGEAFYEGPDSKTDDGQPSGEHAVTVLERAVVYVGYKWNDRLLFNSEIEFEDGGEEVSVEFAYLDFLFKPEFNLRAGHLLLPVGFLNELHEPTTFL
ncbi:MAG TPA: hypothetical protein VN783_15555, partial [Thermoanaerobaculia bacterium]|nr:hypothetical protein [Thermoanaerobaculia bacterium]